MKRLGPHVSSIDARKSPQEFKTRGGAKRCLRSFNSSMIPRPPPRRADRRTRLALVLAGAIVAAGSPALAQILGGGGLGLPGGLPSLPGAAGLRDLPARTAIPALPVPVEPLTQAAVNTLANARALAASRLIREHRDVIEADDR